MESVIWDEHPVLRDPVAIIAFEGWGDAGNASSTAVDYLVELLAGFRFARIEPDEFYDFQVRRPNVEIDEGGTRRIDWPEVSFHALTVAGADRDLVVVTGDEPSSRWKAFTRAMVDVLAGVGVTEAVTLGAFVGQVPHTLPVPLMGVASDARRIEEHQLFASDYEGPTGIVGVLNTVLGVAGIDVMSVWAAVPHYLSGQEYPPGALALLDKALELAGVSLDTSDLLVDVAEFRHQVDNAVQDSDLKEYIEGLEAETLTGDEDVDPAQRLLEEIEKYLQEP
jgi:proteasome assembly chaperone (PAC2) family protein